MKKNVLTFLLILFSLGIYSQDKYFYKPDSTGFDKIKDNEILKNYCTSVLIKENLRLDLFTDKTFRVRESKLEPEKFPAPYQIPFAIGKYTEWNKVKYTKTEDNIFIYITTGAIQIRFFKVNYTWLVWTSDGTKQIYPSDGLTYGMVKDGYSLFDAASYFNEENINSRYCHRFYNPLTKRYDIFLKEDKLIDKYFIYGPDYETIFQQFNTLVGPEPMLPKKGYGYFQTQMMGCDGSQQNLINVIEIYRKLKIPVDNIILDFEWGDACDGTKEVVWGSRLDWTPKYNTPLSTQAFLDSMKRSDLSIMLIHHNVPKYPNKQGDKWTKCIYPWNEWWNSMFKNLDMGVAGTWQDTRQNDITNHFIYNGLEDYTNKRPYFLANYDTYENCGWENDKAIHPYQNIIGNRRAPFNWTGDQQSTWQEFMWSIESVTGFNGSMKGINYLSNDVFGSDWRLQTRWLQFNEFLGLDRTHTQRPWRDNYEALNKLYNLGLKEKNRPDVNEKPEEIEQLINSIRKYRNLRYRLFPYIYTTAHEYYETGFPICRPMMVAFANDEKCNKNQYRYQYMFGENILIAPVYQKDSNSMHVYLPKNNNWIDYWNDKIYEGGKRIDYDVSSIDKLPFFIRSGAIIPMQSQRLRIGKESEDSILFKIYPHGKSTYILYDDDGETLDYMKGTYGTTEVSCEKSNDRILIRLGELKGEFKRKPSKRCYAFEIHNCSSPKNIEFNKVRIKNSEQANKKQPANWKYDPEKSILIIQTNQIETNKSVNIEIN